MNIEDFYNNINGDYDDVLLRLPTPELVKKFLIRFLDDKTFFELENAVSNQKIEQSFESAHKLKGIAANLSFTKFYKLVSALCEEVRSLENQADPKLFAEIKENYELIIEEIKKVD